MGTLGIALYFFYIVNALCMWTITFSHPPEITKPTKVCGDSRCSLPLFTGNTTRSYESKHTEFLSYKPFEEVLVFGVNFSDRPDVWDVEINSKRGYMYSNHVEKAHFDDFIKQSVAQDMELFQLTRSEPPIVVKALRASDVFEEPNTRSDSVKNTALDQAPEQDALNNTSTVNTSSGESVTVPKEDASSVTVESVTRPPTPSPLTDRMLDIHKKRTLGGTVPVNPDTANKAKSSSDGVVAEALSENQVLTGSSEDALNATADDLASASKQPLEAVQAENKVPVEGSSYQDKPRNNGNGNGMWEMLKRTYPKASDADLERFNLRLTQHDFAKRRMMLEEANERIGEGKSLQTVLDEWDLEDTLRGFADTPNVANDHQGTDEAKVNSLKGEIAPDHVTQVEQELKPENTTEKNSDVAPESKDPWPEPESATATIEEHKPVDDKATPPVAKLDLKHTETKQSIEPSATPMQPQQQLPAVTPTPELTEAVKTSPVMSADPLPIPHAPAVVPTPVVKPEATKTAPPAPVYQTLDILDTLLGDNPGPPPVRATATFGHGHSHGGDGHGHSHSAGHGHSHSAGHGHSHTSEHAEAPKQEARSNVEDVHSHGLLHGHSHGGGDHTNHGHSHTSGSPAQGAMPTTGSSNADHGQSAPDQSGHGHSHAHVEHGENVERANDNNDPLSSVTESVVDAPQVTTVSPHEFHDDSHDQRHSSVPSVQEQIVQPSEATDLETAVEAPTVADAHDKKPRSEVMDENGQEYCVAGFCDRSPEAVKMAKERAGAEAPGHGHSHGGGDHTNHGHSHTSGSPEHGHSHGHSHHAHSHGHAGNDGLQTDQNFVPGEPPTVTAWGRFKHWVFWLKDAVQPVVQVLQRGLRFVKSFLPSNMQDMVTEREIFMCFVTMCLFFFYLASAAMGNADEKRYEIRVKHMADLNERLRIAELENDKLRKHTGENTGQAAKLDEALQIQKQVNRELQEEKERLKRDRDELSSSNDYLEKENNQLKYNTEQLDAKLAAAAHEQANIQSEFRQLHHSNAQLEAQMSEMRTAYELARQKCDHYENQQELRLAEIQVLEEARDRLQTELRNAQDEQAHLVRAEQHYKSMEHELRNEVTAKEKEITALKDALASLQLDLVDVGGTASGDEGSTSGWEFEDDDKKREKQARLEKFMDSAHMKAEMKLLEQERDRVKAAFAVETEARRKAEAAQKDAEEKMRKADADHTRLEQQCLQAETRLSILTEYFNKKEAELQKQLGAQQVLSQQKQDMLGTNEEELKFLRTEKAQYDAMLEEVKRDMQNREREFNRFRQEADKQKHELWRASMQAERERDSLKLENDYLRKRVTEQGSSMIGLAAPGAALLGKSPPSSNVGLSQIANATQGDATSNHSSEAELGPYNARTSPLGPPIGLFGGPPPPPQFFDVPPPPPAMGDFWGGGYDEDYGPPPSLGRSSAYRGSRRTKSRGRSPSRSPSPRPRPPSHPHAGRPRQRGYSPHSRSPSPAPRPPREHSRGRSPQYEYNRDRERRTPGHTSPREPPPRFAEGPPVGARAPQVHKEQRYGKDSDVSRMSTISAGTTSSSGRSRMKHEM